METAMSTILHYIYDPLCGWCYAAESLIEAAASVGNLPVVLHGGGLFAGTRLPAAQRAYIRDADQRIGQLSGQSFGAAYLDGLLDDPATVYDSRPPIAALLAAQSLQPDSGLPMLKAIQHAHYRAGRRVVEPSVLAELAVSIGLERSAFNNAYADFAGAKLERHIEQTRELMEPTGVQGFPSFVLQSGDRFAVLPHQQHYGKPQAFAALLSRQLAAAPT
jgi:putative protein-disulfide isomerase